MNVKKISSMFIRSPYNAIHKLLRRTPKSTQQISEEDTVDKHVQESFLAEKNFSDAIINSLPGIFYVVHENMILHRWNENLEQERTRLQTETRGKIETLEKQLEEIPTQIQELREELERLDKPDADSKELTIPSELEQKLLQ